ncbi:hypothetical protein [Roseimaritima ulvae]|nr:hypothetical protein [Roseimaritima ulvae]
MNSLLARPLTGSRRGFLRWLLASAAPLAVGCAQWKEIPDPDGKRGLPAASIADEAAVLDVIFWPVPYEASSDLFDGPHDPMSLLWREVDELAIDPETRQTLAHNGLQAGRIEHIEQWIERIGLPRPSDASEQLMQQASVTSEIANSRHRLPFRSGQQQEFAIRKTSASNQSVLFRQGDHSVGRMLIQPQFLLTVQARPDNDGRVRVRCWPRIEHGPFRQSYVSNDQAIRMNSSRDSWMLHDLAIDLPLNQNQTLILAPTADPFGLGKQMLTDLRPDGTHERVVILIRLARKPEPSL